MDLSRSLLDQADTLLRIDERRPKQVNLRRAISAAYYGVFHRLIRDGAERAIGPRAGGALAERLRAQVTRWYGHAEMKTAASWFGAAATSRNPPEKIARLLGYPKPGIVAPSLAILADALIELQEARHRADYDVDYAPSRAVADSLVRRAQQAVATADALADDPVYHLFLILLLTGDRVVKGR